MYILIIRYPYAYGYFGSYALRQLIANFNDNKDVYIDHIEGDFSKYVEKNLEELGGIVELFAFSNIIDVWIELWCDGKDFRIRYLQTQY